MPRPSDFTPSPNVWLVDTTLRDGAQAPGIAFTARQRTAIAARLADLGIDEIEAGCPAIDSDERQSIRSLVDAKLPCRVTAWCRASESDLVAAEIAHVSAVHLAVPASQVQLSALDKTWTWVEDRLAELVPAALDRFAFVSVGVMDASRTDPSRMAYVATLCQQLGAHRLRLADTVGLWNPWTLASTFQTVAAAVPTLPLGIHAHNDLGMAVANTLAALQAGASTADVTVLGLGERAGNAPLEEVAVACKSTPHLTTRIDTTQLFELCQTVAEYARYDIAPNKPIVGGNAFRHESGIHVRGVLHNPKSFEPFDPAEVGHRRRVELGTHSGRAGLLAALLQVGVVGQREILDDLLSRVREEAIRTRKEVSAQRAGILHQQMVAESQQN